MEEFILRTKNAIKRIAAISAITLMGATAAAGAVAAADLSEYPNTFVEDGMWAAQIVMGLDAKPADVIGATNLAIAITNDAGVPITETATIEGGAKLETADNKVNLYEGINGPRATLTDSQMADLLADGKFVNDRGVSFDYTQQIEISDNPIVDYNEYDDVSDSPALYVYSDDDVELLRYKMIFTNAAESDVDDGELVDFKDTTLTILGKEYEITDADASGTAVKFYLMGGTAKASMFEGDTATYTIGGVDYEVTVSYVGDTATKIIVNGESTKKLEEGETDKVAGITIGVKEVLENEAGEENAGRDMVEFYLGADKITMEDDDITDSDTSNEIRVSEDAIDGVYVGIKMTEVYNADTANEIDDGDVWELNTLMIQYIPDEPVYIYAENPYTDPALGEWKLELTDFTTENEELLKVDTDSSDRIEVSIMMTAGEVDVPQFYVDGDEYYFGKSDEKPFYNDENEDVYTDGGEYFVVSSASNKESYLMQVYKIDLDDNQISFKEATSGDRYTVTYDDDNDNDGTEDGTFTIGSLTIGIDMNDGNDTDEDEADVILNIDMNDNDDYTDTRVPFYTKGGATIIPYLAEELVDQTEYEGVTLTEDGIVWSNGIRFEVSDWDSVDATVTREAGISMIEEPQDDGDNVGAIYITLGLTNDDRSDVKNIYSTNDGGSGEGTDDINFELNAILDNDKYEDYTRYGTKCTLDTTSDQSDATCVYTDSEAYTEVWFSPAGATVTVSGVSGGAGYIMPTDVVAVSDADANTAKPLILVGGPCINKLTAEAMGLEYPACGESSGIAENTAMIKLVEDAFTEGKVAMIVAGWTAADTTKALNTLGSYRAYELTGTGVELSGETITALGEEVIVEEVVEEETTD